MYFSFLGYIIKNYERFVISSNYYYISAGNSGFSNTLSAVDEAIR
jgi:hypothetical protein